MDFCFPLSSRCTAVGNSSGSNRFPPDPLPSEKCHLYFLVCYSRCVYTSVCHLSLFLCSRERKSRLRTKWNILYLVVICNVYMYMMSVSPDYIGLTNIRL